MELALAAILLAVAPADNSLEELAAALQSRGDKTFVRVTKPADLIQLFIKDVIAGKVKLPEDGHAVVKDGKLFLKPSRGGLVEVDRNQWWWVVESMMDGKFVAGDTPDENVAFVPMSLYARYAARLNAAQRKNAVPEKIKVPPTNE